MKTELRQWTSSVVERPGVMEGMVRMEFRIAFFMPKNKTGEVQQAMFKATGDIIDGLNVEGG